MKKYAITKYHILFMKKTMMKIANIKNNCIIEIKIMNEIQCIKIQKSHICVAIYLFKNTKSKIIKK